MTETTGQRRDRGFTLIELVIAIAVVGILSAVAIVGLGGLLGKSHNASCTATADSAHAAAAVHLANSDPPGYPSGFKEMVDAHELELPTGVTATPTAINGKGWVLTWKTGGGSVSPTFNDCPTT
jgi:prepilin-type N-terminal cleavage/methylation domain-containing protein